jgi:hypothetical protein
MAIRKAIKGIIGDKPNLGRSDRVISPGNRMVKAGGANASVSLWLWGGEGVQVLDVACYP